MEIAALRQESLEETLNAAMSLAEANLGAEAEIVAELVARNAGVCLRPSCVRSTFQLRQNADVEVQPYLSRADEAALAELAAGGPVFDADAGAVLQLRPVAALRAECYPEREAVARCKKPPPAGPLLAPGLLQLIDERLPRGRDCLGALRGRGADAVQIKQPLQDDLSSSPRTQLDESLEAVFAAGGARGAADFTTVDLSSDGTLEVRNLPPDDAGYEVVFSDGSTRSE